MTGKRLWILAGLMVTIPLALMGWIVSTQLAEQKAQFQKQFQELTQQRVEQMQSLIASTVEDIRKDWSSQWSPLSTSNTFRKNAGEHPLTNIAFVLSSEGKVLFPSDDAQTSESEKTFLQRTSHVFSRWEELRWTARDEEGDGIESMRSLAQRRVLRQDGWVTWFWGDGLHFIYWMRNSGREGEFWGIEVNRTAFLARLVGQLPENDAGGGSFALVDSAGKTVHSFGGYSVPKGAAPLAQTTLAEPLKGYKLLYFGPTEQWEGLFVKNKRTQQFFAMGLVAAFFLLAAAIFFRENTRRLRYARQRVNFVNQVSHELKTPLTNIRLYAELLEMELDTPSQEKLRVIRSESERLSRMISNILTFSREDRKKLDLHVKEVNLMECVRDVVSQFTLSFDRRGLQVRIKGEALRPVRVDADAAKQILANLLSNSEKYAALGKEVWVTLVQDELRTTVSVRDFGKGIPVEAAVRIFEPFHRLHHHVEEGVSGTGIGLSIARTLAERMGGGLTLQAHDGQGALFVWTLEDTK